MRMPGLVFLLLAQVLVLQAMAHQLEAPLPGLNPLDLELKTQTGVQLRDLKTDKIEDQPVSGATESSSSEEVEESIPAEAPHIRKLGKHRSTDKSVAGGGVIIGGLVTATFAAVFCYIRVTRKRDSGY